VLFKNNKKTKQYTKTEAKNVRQEQTILKTNTDV